LSQLEKEYSKVKDKPEEGLQGKQVMLPLHMLVNIAIRRDQS
ncbi:26622_t:CDS:1, partial [Dentiscutata erythropus]